MWFGTLCHDLHSCIPPSPLPVNEMVHTTVHLNVESFWWWQCGIRAISIFTIASLETTRCWTDLTMTQFLIMEFPGIPILHPQKSSPSKSKQYKHMLQRHDATEFNMVVVVVVAFSLHLKGKILAFDSRREAGDVWCLPSLCLESQGCHLIPFCYLLSCSSA